MHYAFLILKKKKFSFNFVYSFNVLGCGTVYWKVLCFSMQNVSFREGMISTTALLSFLFKKKKNL